MTRRNPVVAAIPNYNMGECLRRLLPQILRGGYDRVFVLDDASTDCSAEVVATYGSDVTLARSEVNRGAGRNRNQILEYVEDGTLIHFVDADMELRTAATAGVARDVFARHADRGVGVIGGLVRRADGTQEPFNYGPVFSLRASLTCGFPSAIDRMRHSPAVARRVAAVSGPAMRAWPKIMEPPSEADAYWVHEGNMLVDAGVFAAVGGYDSRIREHETQDLAIRLERQGVRTHFDPSIEVLHHHAQVRGRFRIRSQLGAAAYLVRTHGVRRWITG